MIKLGNSQINKIMLGDDEVRKVYLGDVQIYPSAPVYQHDYLTFTAVDAGATVRYNALANTTAEYSLDGGNTWTDAVGVTVTLQNVGDSVKYRGTITGDISTTAISRFVLNSNKKVAASGSIMSMYNNNPDDTEIAYIRAFQCMFQNCTSLTSAPELPATTLANYCYNSIFKGCTSLTAAPELPATTLARGCYYQIFQSCSSLTSVTHHITDWNTSNASNWLSGVASSGTVHCPADSTIPSDSASGIPTGWTRIDL